MAEAHLQVGTAELQQRVQYRNMSVEQLIDEHELPSQFDLVCCSEVVEHVQPTVLSLCLSLHGGSTSRSESDPVVILPLTVRSLLSRNHVCVGD